MALPFLLDAQLASHETMVAVAEVSCWLYRPNGVASLR